MKIATLSFATSSYPPDDINIAAPVSVLSNIHEELVRRKHNMTIFGPKDTASKGKITKTNIYSFSKKPFVGTDQSQRLRLAYQKQFLLFNTLVSAAQTENYDLIHAHEFRIFPYFSYFINCPVVHTYHGNPKQDILTPEDRERMKKFYHYNYFVAISEHQIRDGRGLFNFIGKVYHGININQFAFSEQPGDYLLIANRIICIKGVDIAIKSAIQAKEKIVVAGDPGISDVDKKYFKKTVKPLLNHPLVDYRGHVPYDQMQNLYRKAKAYLMPVRVDEAFGLVNIEAMACGTPVIAFNHGSISEIIKDDVGFIIKNDSIEDMVNAIKVVNRISRKKCREYVENNFTIERMVDGYEKMYKIAIKKWKKEKSKRIKT